MAVDDDPFVRQVEVSFELNGDAHTQTVRPNRTLVEFLRENLDLTGTTEGCSVGVCGCCTVLLDGQPINACQELAVNIDGRSVTTIEGLRGDAENDLSPVQEAFRREEGLQCGYCTPGMIVMSHALLEEVPNPDEDYIRHYLAENLCRCTGYGSIIDAVNLAIELTTTSAEDH